MRTSLFASLWCLIITTVFFAAGSIRYCLAEDISITQHSRSNRQSRLTIMGESVLYWKTASGFVSKQEIWDITSCEPSRILTYYGDASIEVGTLNHIMLRHGNSLMPGNYTKTYYELYTLSQESPTSIVVQERIAAVPWDTRELYHLVDECLCSLIIDDSNVSVTIRSINDNGIEYESQYFIPQVESKTIHDTCIYFQTALGVFILVPSTGQLYTIGELPSSAQYNCIFHKEYLYFWTEEGYFRYNVTSRNMTSVLSISRSTSPSISPFFFIDGTCLYYSDSNRIHCVDIATSSNLYSVQCSEFDGFVVLNGVIYTYYLDSSTGQTTIRRFDAYGFIDEYWIDSAY